MSKPRVLVVDDEAVVCNYLAAALGATFEIATAASVDEAIGLLREARFDAVVSDLRMGRLSGLELHGWLKQHQPALAQRMILIGGDLVGGDRFEEADAAELLCLQKPCNPAVLNAAICRLLQPVAV